MTNSIQKIECETHHLARKALGELGNMVCVKSGTAVLTEVLTERHDEISTNVQIKFGQYFGDEITADDVRKIEERKNAK